MNYKLESGSIPLLNDKITAQEKVYMSLMLPFLAALIALAPMAFAGEPKFPDISPVVRTTVPAGIELGKTTEVIFRGRYLENVREIRFATPHIKAELGTHDFYELKAKLTVAPEIRPGLYAYSVITPGGVFSARIHISAIPATPETEPNNDASTAQKITLPVIIDGFIDNADYDNFRLHAEKGQTIVLDVIANRASSPLDAKLAVINERGEEIAFNEDWHLGGDPHIAFTAAEAGDFIVQVSSANEMGGKDNTYRLIAGAYANIDRIFPAGLRRNATNQIELHGQNLDSVTEALLGENHKAKILTKEPSRLVLQLDLAAGLETGPHNLYLRTEKQFAPAPFRVLVSDLAEKRISKTGTREHPEPVDLPIAVTSVLDQKRAAHFVSFKARAGERLTFKVDSMTLGYPLDAVLTIFDSTGHQIAYQDDPAQTGPKQYPEPDPRLTHTFERAGDYKVMIRDGGWTGAPDFVYRLSIQPAKPDYILEFSNPSATLFRGQANKIEVRVKRLDGWNTPVDVWLDNAPAGIEATKTTAQNKPSEYKDNCAKLQQVDGTDVELTLKVDAKAESNLYPLRIRARGVIDGQTIERTLEAVYTVNGA